MPSVNHKFACRPHLLTYLSKGSSGVLCCHRFTGLSFFHYTFPQAFCNKGLMKGFKLERATGSVCVETLYCSNKAKRLHVWLWLSAPWWLNLNRLSWMWLFYFFTEQENLLSCCWMQGGGDWGVGGLVGLMDWRGGWRRRSCVFQGLSDFSDVNLGEPADVHSSSPPSLCHFHLHPNGWRGGGGHHQQGNSPEESFWISWDCDFCFYYSILNHFNSVIHENVFQVRNRKAQISMSVNKELNRICSRHECHPQRRLKLNSETDISPTTQQAISMWTLDYHEFMLNVDSSVNSTLHTCSNTWICKTETAAQKGFSYVCVHESDRPSLPPGCRLDSVWSWHYRHWFLVFPGLLLQVLAFWIPPGFPSSLLPRLLLKFLASRIQTWILLRPRGFPSSVLELLLFSLSSAFIFPLSSFTSLLSS